MAGGNNLYAYVYNDPLNLTDPYGLAADGPLRDIGNYLSNSGDALSRAPGDFMQIGRDFVGDPGETLRRLGPSLAGLGMSIPMAVAGAPATAAETAGASGSRVAGLASDLESYLGPGFTKIESPTGNSIFRSADGTRQIRFDLNDFHGDPNGPHINLETWTPRNLYPGDTRMQQIENLHLYPKGP